MVVKDFTLYKKAILVFKEGHISKYNTLISNKFFSHSERRLLKSRVLLRDKQWDNAISSLLKISLDNHLYLIAERDALVSYAYSCKSDWQNAFIFNDKSIDNYKMILQLDGLFNSLYNQSVYTSRMGQVEVSSYYIEKSAEYCLNIDQEILLVRAKAANLSKLGMYKKAIELLKENESKLVEIDNEYTINEYRLVMADIYFRNRELESAFAIYKSLIQIKKTPVRMRILFEYKLIEYFIDKTSCISWSEHIKDNSEYSLKVEIIDLLNSGRSDEAQDLWIKLARKVPHYYLPNFKVRYKSDEKALFYSYIQLIRNKKSQKVLDANLKLSGKQEALYKALRGAEFPVSKENLIEMIWADNYDPKYDARLYKLIQRLKESAKIDVLCEKGGYFIK